MDDTETAPVHDLIVVSDLHIGRGKNPETGRFYELEAFFYDEDFRAFCVFLCEDAARRGVGFKLVLNGDAFDLLRIDRDVGQRAAASTSSLIHPGSVSMASTTLRGRRFGPVMTPDAAAAAMLEITAGHPVFIDALASVLLAGHEVIFLPGNHDLELQWPRVQAVILDAVERQARRRADEPRARAASSRLSFQPWFYHEPGRAWVEHGCQYDPENAFRYLLRGELDDCDAPMFRAEQDMPLGNFFQRYLYNAFGHITFIVPSTRANLRYFKWLVLNKPHLLLRVFASHSRFWLQVLRRLAKPGHEVRKQMRESHERALDELARASGLGAALLTIDTLKAVRTDLHQAIRSLGWQALRVLVAATLIALFAFGLWFAGFHGIHQLRGGFVFKASLFLLLDFLFLLMAMAGIAFAVVRSATEPSSRPLRRCASKIAKLLDVPIVCFGHTHEEVLWRLKARRGRPGGAWYFNTGTWIAVFTHDELLPRDRVQYTYLHVRGNAGDLLHWSPGRGAPVPVILLDEREPDAGPSRPS
ncbi:MAG: hypothetical protein H6713_17360 [Myxococcales bacterium]|nr:hypothetical protein [Myxococcales bacterium]MCB9751745.1 hypothetical protein [Myxococcales bacterium]